MNMKNETKLSNTQVKKIAKSMKPYEAQWLNEVRKFNEKEMKGVVRDLYVKMEEAQVNVDTARFIIKTNLLKMHDVKLAIDRIKMQTVPGIIWRHVDGYPDIKLTKDELESEINNLRHQMDSYKQTINIQLVTLLSYIGQLRVDRKVLITEDEFNKYYTEVNDKVKELTGTGLL